LRVVAEEQAALRRLATLVARGVPPDEVFAAVTEEVARVLPVQLARMGRYESDGAVTFVAASGMADAFFPPGTQLKLGGKNVTTLVAQTGRSARIDGYADASGPIGVTIREAGIRSAVATPITVEDHLWGVMAVASTLEPRLPTGTEARLAQFTELLAMAVANAESRGGMARLAEEQAALQRVATLVARAVPPDELFAAVAEEVGHVLRVEYTHMGRYEPDGTFVFIAVWSSADPLVEVGSRLTLGGKNLATLVFDTGLPTRIDTFADASGSIGVAGREAGVRSAIGTPIVVEDRLWGAMTAGSVKGSLPLDAEGRLAQFTDLLATAIANAESRAGLARLAEVQAALRRVATLVAQGVPPEELFAAVAEEVVNVLPVQGARIGRYESDGTVTFVATTVGPGAAVPAAARMMLGEKNLALGGKNLATFVFETGRAARLDNFGDASGPIAARVRELGGGSAVGTPIVVDGRLWGLATAGSTLARPLPPDTEARLTDFTDLVAMAIANAQSRAALRPVERMRSLAEQITEHELSGRLPESDAADEIAALGRTLNAMLDRIEAAVARERRVVSNASHELRTPLTTLRAEVDLALMGDRGKPELRAALESAAEEARRMSRLADDLLVLARADQGRLPLRPEPLAVRELLEHAAGRARAATELRARSIVVRDVPDGWAVRADPDRAAQALDNLITNALRYGDGAITLTARSNDDHIELHVTDEGHGFPDELLPLAFERFGRGHHARSNEPGSGLGLALVEAVAVAHGGHADARNRRDGGADVSIALPSA
jgi:signal transduction histidine kinase